VLIPFSYYNCAFLEKFDVHRSDTKKLAIRAYIVLF